MWKLPAQHLVDEVGKHLAKSMDCIVTDANGVSRVLTERILAKWAQKCRSLVDVFKNECEMVLQKAVEFGTMNHYLVDKYAEELLMPDQCVDDFIDNLEWNDLHKPTLFSDATLQQREGGHVHRSVMTGMSVKVNKPFVCKDSTDLKKSYELPPGSSGRVKEIFRDGSACIHFQNVSGGDSLVVKTDFNKLDREYYKVPWKQNLKSALTDATSRWIICYTDKSTIACFNGVFFKNCLNASLVVPVSIRHPVLSTNNQSGIW